MTRTFFTTLVFVSFAAVGCASSSAGSSGGGDTLRATTSRRATRVPEPTLVTAVGNIPHTRPANGRYRIHLVDVGTGLAVFVQGHDFTLLYDGGSKDSGESGASTRTDDETRLLSYLFAALGPSGGCDPEGDDWGPVPSERTRIDHVVLSHPHSDHGSMLDEVLRCYEVTNVWDSGVASDTDFYWAYLDAVANADGLTYRTVRTVPADRLVAQGVGSFSMPEARPWVTFAAGDRINLGAGARAVVVQADPDVGNSDVNMASVVMRLDLGSTSLLLTGDIESGPRLDPQSEPAGGEADMLANDRALLDVDILQVAHHGSMTSSRTAFLDAVSPQVALIGAGPTRYSGVTLPDAEVIEALEDVGARIYRTDTHDDGTQCSIEGVEDRVGRESGPGGCDNYVFEVR